MIEVRQTEGFEAWLRGLRDRVARNRVLVRIRRAETGNLGDVKSIGDGVFEMRIDHGPGYRLYFVREGAAIVLLLCGGDKSTQDRDIKEARRLAREL